VTYHILLEGDCVESLSKLPDCSVQMCVTSPPYYGLRDYGMDGQLGLRSVWSVTTKPFKGAHFATFPPDLIEPCILAGSGSADTVLDPFGGSGTTALVSNMHGRNSILCELNPDYAAIAQGRVPEIKIMRKKVAA
jgi:DNA modification methylase